MNLNIKNVSELLGVSEKIIHQWIKEKKIPSYKIGYQYRFNKEELKNWILKKGLKVSSQIFGTEETGKKVKIVDLLERGGIYYQVKGNQIIDVIKNVIELMPTPSEITKDTIIYQLIEREEMMPTSIGKGIAIPHPRNPLIADIENERIALCFLKNPFKYQSFDQIPIHTLFILLSANSKRHLQILSKISFLCQQDEFIELLKRQPDREVILSYIEQKEIRLEKRITE